MKYWQIAVRMGRQRSVAAMGVLGVVIPASRTACRGFAPPHAAAVAASRTTTVGTCSPIMG